MKLEVWAPNARTVMVRVGNESLAMTRKENGYWEAEAAMASAGADYFFVVDNKIPMPDPRSAYQPHGIHGASRFFERTISACAFRAMLSGAERLTTGLTWKTSELAMLSEQRPWSRSGASRPKKACIFCSRLLRRCSSKDLTRS
jgi:hypothetical protein